jgi:hypothetical protein
MNIMISAVGVDPGFAIGGGGAQEAAALGAFVVAGLILLFAARRLCRRNDLVHQAARYTGPRL